MKGWQIWCFAFVVALSLYVFTAISLRLAAVRERVQEPQAIFVLGGGIEREVFAAELALQHPDLKVWISSGSDVERTLEVFRDKGVSRARLVMDRRATDTVTNFTTMVDRFVEAQIEYVYLVTSDYHMRRARVIAFFVFGSRGIVCMPVAVGSKEKKEYL